MTGALIAVSAVLVLLPRSGSIVGGVGPDTVAVFMIGSACEKPGGTEKEAVLVRDAPAASGPRRQGNVAGVQELATDDRPAADWRVMIAPATSDGPLFVTVRVYVTLFPGVVVAGPVFSISRSATG